MTKKEAVAHYGSVVNLAKALGISRFAIHRWKDHPPKLRQFELERLTGGELRADV